MLIMYKSRSSIRDQTFFGYLLVMNSTELTYICLGRRARGRCDFGLHRGLVRSDRSFID